jgi:uracil-DNA glycosylase family 4
VDRQALRLELAEITRQAQAAVKQEASLHPHAQTLLNQPLPPGRQGQPLPDKAIPEMDFPSEQPPNPMPQAPWADSLEAFHLQIRGCQRCKLGASRKQMVFGEGRSKADLLFVDEAPGAEEDAKGRPCVGPSGQLLDRMIAAMGFQRSQVYMLNIVRCRPPIQRGPLPEELSTCHEYLMHQIALIKPKAICALGPQATLALLGPEQPWDAVRGKILPWHGAHLAPIHHPSALNRDAGLKREVWDQMKALLKVMSVEAQ